MNLGVQQFRNRESVFAKTCSPRTRLHERRRSRKHPRNLPESGVQSRSPELLTLNNLAGVPQRNLRPKKGFKQVNSNSTQPNFSKQSPPPKIIIHALRAPTCGQPRATVRSVCTPGATAVYICRSCFRQLCAVETRVILIARWKSLFSVCPLIEKSVGVISPPAATTSLGGGNRANSWGRGSAL